MFWKKDTSNEPSLKQKEEEMQNVQLFEEGNKYLDVENYESAAQSFEKILQAAPSTNLELVTVYNLGMAYEGKKDCRRAVKMYRRLVKSALQDQARIQAQALYRLSHAYECLGLDTKVVTSLIDVKKRVGLLPEEVAFAEVPARLASSYARMGNRKLADHYFKEAEDGIKRVVSIKKSKEQQQEIMSKTLYMMGFFDPKRFASKDWQEFVFNLEYIQKYLLKSAELDHPVWSARAAEKIVEAYDQVWPLVKDFDSQKNDDDEAISAREKILLRRKLVTSSLNNIKLLRKERMPEDDENQLVAALFDKLDKKELEFNKMLATNFVDARETKENTARFGTKQKVRLVDPEPARKRAP